MLFCFVIKIFQVKSQEEEKDFFETTKLERLESQVQVKIQDKCIKTSEEGYCSSWTGSSWSPSWFGWKWLSLPVSVKCRTCSEENCFSQVRGPVEAVEVLREKTRVRMTQMSRVSKNPWMGQEEVKVNKTCVKMTGQNFGKIPCGFLSKRYRDRLWLESQSVVVSKSQSIELMMKVNRDYF